MRKIFSIGILAAFMVILVGISIAQNADDDAALEAELSGENEVPPTNSTATGEATAALDGNQLTVEGSFEGLTSDLVSGASAHIHENVPGANGPIVFDLIVDADDDNKSGTFSLTTTLGNNQVQDLITEQYYINIHTTSFPDGEIRGQLMVVSNVTVQLANETNQTVNETVNVTAQANATGAADLHIMQWYPKGPDHVFVCNITGFEPTSYTWFYGDGHKLLNIRNQNTYHVYEALGNYTVMCSGTDGVNTASDTLEINVTSLVRPLSPLFGGVDEGNVNRTYSCVNDQTNQTAKCQCVSQNENAASCKCAST